MPLTWKRETACLQTMTTEPTATLQCNNPKTGSALMMNHSEHLHCNIVGRSLLLSRARGVQTMDPST